MMYARFDAKIQGRMRSCFGNSSGWVSLLIWSVVGVFLLWTWIYDFFWLFCCKRDKFEEYLKELQDELEPKPDPGCLGLDPWAETIS